MIYLTSILIQEIGLKYAQKINKELEIIHKTKDFNKLLKGGKLIGSGDWGNVYISKIKNYKFAIKFSRLDKKDLDHLYSFSSNSWYEILMLRKIIKPLIETKICPNIPLLIDTFVCDKSEFMLREQKKVYPAVITVTELANGDLRDYLKFETPTDNELYSALFQIMAGLHCLQKYGQILNNDIKARNILYYNVKEGGYWKYKINGKYFYVPNYGKIFVLNDFGVSTIYNPDIQMYPDYDSKMFNLGSRFAININGIFSPVHSEVEINNNKYKKTDPVRWIDKYDSEITSYGAKYKMYKFTNEIVSSETILTSKQKEFLYRKKICTNPKKMEYFSNPLIIPPFEFYNDTQDVIRMFIGGKRTTQRGHHKEYLDNTNKKFMEKLSLYKGKSSNINFRSFSLYSYYVLAGEFITTFFSRECDYTRERNKCIEYFRI